MKIRSLFFSVMSICWSMAVSAQGGWEDYFEWDTVGNQQPICKTKHIAPTPDGGYIAVGHQTSNDSLGFMRKYDAFGNVQWSKLYNDGGIERPEVVIPLSTGGYVMSYQKGPSVGGAPTVFLMRTNANGDILWSQGVQGFPLTQIGENALTATADGNYVLGGVYYMAPSVFRLIKTDGNGTTLWDKQYNSAYSSALVESVRQTSDGGYIVAGTSNGSTSFANYLLAVKTDANGDTLWTRYFGHPAAAPYGYDAVELSNGNYIFVGSLQNDIIMPPLSYGVAVWCTNSAGDSLWANYLMGIGIDGAYSVVATSDGGFALTGASNGKLYVQKSDANGVIQWERSFNSLHNNSTGYCIRQTADGGYIVGGSQDSFGAVLRLDANGNTLIDKIRGYVFADADNNCAYTTAEDYLSGRIVKAENASNIYYGTTDANGYYEIPVEAGSYTVSVIPQLYWAASCVPSAVLTLNSDTIDQDFPMEMLISCPLMEVNMNTFALRRCMDNTYYVQYCNTGTVTESASYVTIELDPYLSYVSSSIPVSGILGNQFTFLLPPVPANTCGSFSIVAYLDCNAVVGQSHCSQAHIYPDTPCISWSGAVIEAAAACQTDTVAFSLLNSGNTMNTPLQYFVYEDNVMLRTGSFQLNNGQTTTIAVPTNGLATYYIYAEQEAGIPHLFADNMAAAGVQGCNPFQDFSVGVIGQLEDYDAMPWMDIDCTPNTAAFDPNDKQASPVGYGNQHYIYTQTDIDYMIRFQNTGNDTAFNVVLLDTLSAFLDPATIQMGTSSHAYTWQLLQSNILRIEFSNIFLPDSNVNEPASHGFVRFNIAQQPNNPLGSVIENSAAIYFDFNAPVITNTTFHEVSDNFMPVSVELLPDGGASDAVRVYPNPMQQTAYFETAHPYQRLHLSLYDMTGRTIGEWEAAQSNQLLLMRPTHCPAGVYLYRLEGDGVLLQSGKLAMFPVSGQ